MYCGDTAAGAITVIDTDTLRAVGTVPAEPGAGSIAVDAERGRAYCANMLSASVTVFDPATLRPLERIAVGECPCKVAVWGLEGTILLDETGRYAARLGIRGVPSNVVVDSSGLVRAVGVTTPAELEDAVSSLLATD